MATPSHITVINTGDTITVGGIVFAAGQTMLHTATLDLLLDLGLVSAARTPHLFFDVLGLNGHSSLSLALNLGATGKGDYIRGAKSAMTFALTASGTVGA